MKANILPRSLRPLAVVLLVLTVLPAYAQPGPGPGAGKGHHRGWDSEDRMERRVEFLQDRLDLSDDQVGKLQEILEARQAEARKWMDENEDATRDQRMEFMKSHRQATEEAIETILTPDQKEEYAAISRRFDRQAGRMAQRRDAFFDELDLTPEQRTQLDELQQSHMTAMRAWAEQNPNATPEERAAFRDQLHKSGLAAMKGFLTPEQIEKIDSHHKQMGMGMGMGMGMKDGMGMGMRDGMGHGRGQRGEWGRGFEAGRLAGELDLTDEQLDQIKELRKSVREQQCTSFRQGLETILTPEQLQELREARKNRGGDGRRWGGWMGDCWD